MKPYLLLAFLIPLFSTAQKKPYVFVLDSLNKEVKSADSVVTMKPGYYIRVIHDPEPGETLYKLSEYHINKKPKRVGTVSRIKPLILEGQITEFDFEGNRQSVTTYERGKPMGQSFMFYAGGKVKMQMEYFSWGNNTCSFKNTDIKSGKLFKIINQYDSAGNQLIKDGYGFITEWSMDSTYYEEGRYVEGLMDSTWKFVDKKEKYSRVEVYDKGCLISGISTFENGSTFKYNKIEAQPEFPGGIEKLYGLIAKEFRYPTEIEELERPTTVYLKFVVEKDGSLSDIKFLKDPGMGLEEEAIRVLTSLPKWNPGVQNGKPVRIAFGLPINIGVKR